MQKRTKINLNQQGLSQWLSGLNHC